MTSLAKRLIEAMDSGHDILSSCACKECDQAKKEMLVQALRALQGAGPSDGMRGCTITAAWQTMLSALIAELEATDA